MLSLLKKIRNWLVFGKFVSVYTIAYKCNNVINSFTIEAKSKREAIRKTYEKGRDCKMLEIIEIREF